MRDVAFAVVKPRIEAVLAAVEALLIDHPRPSTEWAPMLRSSREKMHVDAMLRLAVVGQFNAGKSSLIAALTGAAVHIDADVSTTEIVTYEWLGLSLLDTPGVHATGAPTKHDELSRQAVVGADLVLFVATASLFSDRLAQHFRWLAGADGLGVASKMAVVVNKMDQERNDWNVILEEVSAAIAPHDSVPIFLCSARSRLDAATAPEPLRTKFEQTSNFDVLVAGIDKFVSERQLTARLATPLRVADVVLAEAAETLAAESSGNAQSEQLDKRRRRILEDAGRSIAAVTGETCSKMRMQGAELGEQCVRRITDKADQAEVEEILERNLAKLGVDVGELSDQLQERIKAILERADNELEELGASPLGVAVAMDEKARVWRAGAKVDVKRGGDGRGAKKVVKTVQAPLRQGLEHLARNPRMLRDALYNGGKALGMKFRPWEALNAGKELAKIAGGLGKALPLIGLALDAYFVHQEEAAVDKRRAQLAGARAGIHRTFAEQAEQEAVLLRASITEQRTLTIGAAEAALQEELLAAAAAVASSEKLAERLSVLRSEVRALGVLLDG
ncbi:MAG TPA: GTPase [Polyangiaceae bacterium]|nr:GTPase [Polyangiaceae bacterium]